MKNKRSGLSNGLIKIIKNDKFIYTWNTYPGSSGGFIVNQNTKFVIGIHKGEVKNENLKNKKINMNVGTFMRNIIDDINNNKNNEISEKQDKLNFLILDQRRGSTFVCYDSNITIRDMILDFLKKSEYYYIGLIDPNLCIFKVKLKILNSSRYLNKSLKDVISEGDKIYMFVKRDMTYG